eukprot:2465497-Ditylum_brightwellii.AAC.1
MPKKHKNTKKSAATQLVECDIASECTLLLSRRERSDNGETLLFDEDGLSELCFDIIADIDANDNNYDPDVKHLLSYPNNPTTKK